MFVLQQRVEPPARVWIPFVVAGLLSTVTVGALSGSIDLWAQRVRLSPVPIEHAQGHGLAQVFGFMLLITMGLSLHLVPRFFGLAEVGARWARVQAWLCIGGLVGVVLGRLGALMPGSWWLGPVGAALLWVGVTRWLALLWVAKQSGHGTDWLGVFLVSGSAWWWVAASGLVVWQLAQLVRGPMSSMALEPLYALGLWGGAGSWIFGVMLRAGICTLRLERPSVARQRVLWVSWQVAVLGAVWAAVAPTPVAFLLAGAGVFGAIGALRPWTGALASLPNEGFPRRVVQAGLLALGLAGLMLVWRAVWPTSAALLGDAARHTYTLGFCTLTVFGFGGRMVPGFAGRALVWPSVYGTGALFVGAGAMVRWAELWPTRGALAVAGTSGVLAALGVTMMVSCLLRTLATREATRLEASSTDGRARREGGVQLRADS